MEDLCDCNDSKPRSGGSKASALSAAAFKAFPTDYGFLTSDEYKAFEEEDEEDPNPDLEELPPPKRPRIKHAIRHCPPRKTESSSINHSQIKDVNGSDLFSKLFDQPFPYYPEPFDPDHPMMKGVKALQYDYTLLTERELDHSGERRGKKIGRKWWYWQSSPLRSSLTAVREEE